MTEEKNIEEPSRGLGDTIAKITHATGIDKLVDAAADILGIEDCGCEQRRELLNKAVPYKTNTPDPIPTPIDVSLYVYEGERTFKVLQQLIVNVKDKQEVYPKESLIRVKAPDGVLYSFLKNLLEKGKIEPYLSS